ncbi:MAG: AMP-binding enzyme, partial [Acidobacteriaceae bacterium]
VATSEVSEAICAFPGVKHANVYGVAIPANEGRACMAALVPAGELDLSALFKHMAARLPSYARPVFLRLQDEIEVTGTFKYSKTELVNQGYDPGATPDRIYFNDPGSGGWVRVDEALHDRIRTGQIRL